jgi:hypothetical protein
MVPIQRDNNPALWDQDLWAGKGMSPVLYATFVNLPFAMVLFEWLRDESPQTVQHGVEQLGQLFNASSEALSKFLLGEHTFAERKATILTATRGRPVQRWTKRVAGAPAAKIVSHRVQGVT